jgi:5-formyltetrahydrofolate cyclo-ligase
MGDPQHLKAALRVALEAAWDAVEPAERARETEALLAHLARWVSRQSFEVVLATLPLAREADLTPFFRAWLASAGRLAFSRTLPERQMDFGYVKDLEGGWRIRSFGMREPPASATAWEPGPKTLLLVPGIAFAPSAGAGAARLGHGAGYFDRWLAASGPSVTAVGFGLSCQIVPSLPEEAHDRRLDGWLDPEGSHGL